MGRVGCGAVSQVRSREGGVRSDNAFIVVFGIVVVFFLKKRKLLGCGVGRLVGWLNLVDEISDAAG